MRRRIDLIVIKSARWMLPGQANCKAFSMRINTFTLIHVK